MSTVRGYGRWLGALGTTSDLLMGKADVFPPDPTPAIVADWMLPPGPPAAVQIPYLWLRLPLRGRPDKPLTTAHVSQASGVTADRIDDASVDEYGDNPFTVTLATACDDDPANLAEHMLRFYATQPGSVPRTRFPSLTLVPLNARTPGEKWRLMDLKQGVRISITGTPTTWPAGASQQIVEGIRHSGGGNERLIELNTAPVVGDTPGVAGPWFRLGKSRLGSGDQLIP